MTSFDSGKPRSTAVMSLASFLLTHEATVFMSSMKPVRQDLKFGTMIFNHC